MEKYVGNHKRELKPHYLNEKQKNGCRQNTGVNADLDNVYY